MKTLDFAREICGSEDPLDVWFDLRALCHGRSDDLMTDAGRRIDADPEADLVHLRRVVSALANGPHNESMVKFYGPHWRMDLR